MENKLKELGLTPDQVKQTLAIAKAEIDGNYIPKTRFNEVNDKLKESTKLVDTLKNDSASIEDYKAKIATYEKTIADNEARYANEKRELALDQILTGEKAKNPKALKALLDVSKITFEDGKFTGLVEQIAEIKKSDSYLFATTQEENFGNKVDPNGTNPNLDGVEKAFIGLNPNLKL